MSNALRCCQGLASLSGIVENPTPQPTPGSSPTWHRHWGGVLCCGPFRPREPGAPVEHFGYLKCTTQWRPVSAPFFLWGLHLFRSNKQALTHEIYAASKSPLSSLKSKAFGSHSVEVNAASEEQFALFTLSLAKGSL